MMTPLKQLPPLILRLDSGGRRGKIVTLVEGLLMHPAGKEALLGELKRKCGAGGAVKMGRLEIQGDHRDRLRVELKSRGYRIKPSGG